jgi:hypothetical protein
MSDRHRHSSAPPPRPLGAMRQTSIPWGHNPRTIVVDGVPILFVDAEHLARIKGQHRTVFAADLETIDTEETT